MTPHFLAHLSGFVALATLVPAAQADILAGHVVDENGVPVGAVNVDVVDILSGQDVPLVNDSTNANGDFAVDVPPGLYRLILFPPRPPQTNHLVTSVEDIPVVGFTDVGTVTLTPGFALLGRVVGPANQPVADVNLDVVDLVTHDQLILPGDITDFQGRFTIVVPRGPFEVRYDPAAASGGPFAPRSDQFDLAQDTNLGNVPLAPGLLVSMTVRGPSGKIQGADLDVMDSMTGNQLFTPSDNTDGNGFVDVVLPSGTFDIEICAPFSERTVAQTLLSVVITIDQDLGNIDLSAGVVLSGHVVDPLGMSLVGVDLNVFDSFSGVQVTTCADNTDSAGNYAVIVPQGNLDVKFRPRFTDKVGSLLVPVTLFGDTVLNASLPACDCGKPRGRGVAGSGGFVPRLRSRGGPLRRNNSDWGVRLDRGLGGALGSVVMGVGDHVGGGPPPPGGQTGLFDGLLRQIHHKVIQLKGTPGVPGAGHRLVALPIPNDTALVGLTIAVRAAIRDPGAQGGVAVTRTLVGTACD